ncbi:MAG: sigma-70 family RNA polymerase sigma factor [Verrucomicrobia bacterium]|nr:sigma-70 family RNA polymerase sigma factor [Verrucomicrobiota bacterium]
MNEGQKPPAERFLELLRPVERDLEVYCRRLFWNEQETLDAIQNAVLRAWAAFDRYHENASFRAWLFKILTNEVFALNRKYARIAQSEFHLDARQMDLLPALEQAAAYTDWLLSPEALRDALDQDLIAALRTLTETERAVLLMRGIGNLRYREFSDSLDIPLGSVMGHLARARRKMREAIRSCQRRATL